MNFIETYYRVDPVPLGDGVRSNGSEKRVVILPSCAPFLLVKEHMMT